LNIQTEHLEDHRAKFTVEIDVERLETAKQKASRNIAKKVNIPGFRKGKVPYRVLIQNGLEPAILEDAIEELSQEIYRETLDQSDIEPYGPGSFEDYNLENTPTFIYTVPLQPTVKLGDYRAIRRDYEEPTFTEDEVDEQLQRLLLEQAEYADSAEAVQLGNRVTVDIHSTFADDPVVVEGDEESEAQPKKGDQFIHQHDAKIYLDPNDEPVLKGFKEALIGANIGDDLDFELTIPEGDEDYADIAGRKIQFNVNIAQIETVLLDELNDEFAAKVTAEEEDGPLNLEQLRARISESILDSKTQSTKDAYFTAVIDEIVGISEFSFPQMMIDEQVEDLIKGFEERLKRSGMSLDVYLSVTGQTKEAIEQEYQEPAILSIKRSLAMREIITSENLTVPEAEITKRIDELVSRFGEQAEAIRGMFDTPDMRLRMANDVLQEFVVNRVVAIARGEEIPEPSDEEATPVDSVVEAEATTEDEAPATDEE
jgi:trigger factor